MAIHFKCKCGNRMEAPEDFIGKEARCGVCGKYCIVPAKSEFVAETAVRPKPGLEEGHAASSAPPAPPSGLQAAGYAGMVLGGVACILAGVLSLAGQGAQSGAVQSIGLGVFGLSLVAVLAGHAGARR